MVLVLDPQALGAPYRLACGQMNRADLSWALNAVIPHAGRKPWNAYVGITCTDWQTYLYATDDYTIGVARIDGSANVDVRLSPKEATELMRWVRPSRVAEQEQGIAIAQREAELHIGWDDESAVFETVEPGLVSLDTVLAAIRAIDDLSLEFRDCVYQPRILERFAKAARADHERLRFMPRQGASGKMGLALVTVGTDFIGGIAGMTYDEQGPATVAEFLTDHTEGKAA